MEYEKDFVPLGLGSYFNHKIMFEDTINHKHLTRGICLRYWKWLVCLPKKHYILAIVFTTCNVPRVQRFAFWGEEVELTA